MSPLATMTGLLAMAGMLGQVYSHSWVEQMQQIASDGTFTGAMGYPRSYVSRTDPSFNGNSMDYLLPPLTSGRTRLNATDLLCHPSQRDAGQSTNYPMLSMKPGGYVAMKYLENGHVTLPNNQLGKPQNGGTVFVYGTASPKNNEMIMDVLQWTQDGTGGDGRGTMIAAQNFDDGRCHQINSGAISVSRQRSFPDRLANQPTSNVEQWCETDVQIPASTTASTLTLYWVWQWNTVAGADPGLPDGKDEYYTSCADISLSQTTSVNKQINGPAKLIQQDPQTNAIKTFQARTALVAFPLSGSSLAAPSKSSTSTSSLPLTTPAVSTKASTPTAAPKPTAASTTVHSKADVLSVSVHKVTLTVTELVIATSVTTYTAPASSLAALQADLVSVPPHTLIIATSTTTTVSTTASITESISLPSIAVTQSPPSATQSSPAVLLLSSAGTDEKSVKSEDNAAGEIGVAPRRRGHHFHRRGARNCRVLARRAY